MNPSVFTLSFTSSKSDLPLNVNFLLAPSYVYTFNIEFFFLTTFEFEVMAIFELEELHDADSIILEEDDEE